MSQHLIRVIANNYLINPNKKLGRGLFGTIYLGKSLKSGERVAVKEVIHSFDTDMESTKTRELRHHLSDGVNRWLGLQGHPNIVKFLDMDTDEWSLWITMEHCAGGDLLSNLKEHKKPLPLDCLFRYMLEASAGVDFLHQQTPPIAHLDIKLTNFLVQTGKSLPVLKLSDFGLMTLVSECADIRGYNIPLLVGTADFMAPEYFMQGSRLYDMSFDVFSLGLVFQVLMNYDGEEDSLRPLSVEIRREKRVNVPFGQELALAVRRAGVMPELFEYLVTEPDVTYQLKKVIEKMVQHTTSDRLTAQQVCDHLQSLKKISITTMADVQKKLSMYLNRKELDEDQESCSIQGYYVQERKPEKSPEILVVNVNSGCKEIAEKLLHKFLEYLKQLNPQPNENVTTDNFMVVEQKSTPEPCAWKSNAKILFERVGSIAFLAKYKDTEDDTNHGVGAVVACHTVTEQALVTGLDTEINGNLFLEMSEAVHVTMPFEGINRFKSSRQDVSEQEDDELPAVDIGMLYLTNHLLTAKEKPIDCKIFRGTSEDLPNEIPVFKKDEEAVTGSVFIKSFSGPLFPGKPAYGDIMVVRPVGSAPKFSDVGESGRAVLFKDEAGEANLLGYVVAVQENFTYENSNIDHVTYVLYLHQGLEALKEYCHKEITVEGDLQQQEGIQESYL